MSDQEKQTVFIIDDDSDIRTSLSRSLTKRGFDVECFASANSFLNFYDESLSGCLLLDYGMPEINGLELQQKLLEKNFSIPIIFMTGHGGIPESVQAMKAGAIDFLEKPFKQAALINAIRSAFENAEMTLQDSKTIKELKDKFNNLTTREKEVAQFIIQNPADTSSKNIGRHLNVSPRTVDHHRAQILEKMEMNSVTELIEKSITTKLLSRQ